MSNRIPTRASFARSSARLAALALFASLAGTAPAQQFTQAVGALPGPARWSEGVAAVDVDLDGDLDLLFADGDGFSSAGAKRQNVLLRNRLVEQGAATFVDESTARLGVHLSNAKMVIAGDVDGDGWPDLLFANAFNTDPPFLYLNRGAAQPGFFDLVSAARGLTESLNSAGAQLADVDDDGDLDLVVTDSGASLLGGTGGVPRLYLNDGAGFFTEAAAQLPAPVKRAHMDVALVDVDRDLDLDLFGVNRATNAGGNHYLMLNDGAGSFADASGLLPSTSGNAYEGEVGDFDGDTDLDLFFLSLTGLQDGHVRNDLAPSGALGFTAGTAQPGSVDDNEIGLLDYDMDGDLDVFVGSLGSRERVYRNDGGLVFTDTAGVVAPVFDSTLDLALADLDNDGDYDLVTAQGESGDFTNRLYWNSGPADSRAPRFVDLAASAATATSPALVHAVIRDEVADDGVAYLTASALSVRVAAAILEVEVRTTGFTPSMATVPSGTRVRFVDAGTGATTLNGAAPFAFSRELPAGGEVARVFVAPGHSVVTSPAAAGALVLIVQGAPVESRGTQAGGDLFRLALPALPPGPTGELAAIVRAVDWPGNVAWSDTVTVTDFDAVGVRYCEPNPNSTGSPARIVARGTDFLAAQTLALEAWALPAQSFGFFLLSRTRGVVPVSQGVLCLGQPIGRLSDFVQHSGQSGAVALPLPFAALPPALTFAVGETWDFQYWFRDANPAVGANFSDAIEVTWR